MIKQTLFLSLSLTLTTLIFSQPTASLHIDWASFLSRHDMVWNKMPNDYYEGPFVGNGLMGAILFKDDQQKNTFAFEIGRTDVYDHRTASIKSTNAVGRLPIGRLLLAPKGEIKDIKLRTDLWNAEITGVITTTLGKINIRCFTPSGEELVILNLRTTGQEQSAHCFFRPEQGNHPRPTVQPTRDKGIYLPNPPFHVDTVQGIEVVTQPLLAGDDYATAWNEQTGPNGERTVMVTVSNRWAKKQMPATGSATDAVATLLAVRKKGIALMEKAHRNWWHNYYPSSFVTIPDAHQESFYWIQMYKLASATRSDQPVVDLMGPWFKKTVWASYWTNLNIQLAYFTLGITNHLDIDDGLYKLIERHTNDLITNVPPEYQNDCAALGNPVGFDTLHATVGISDNNKTPMHLIALPWLMQMFYTHNQMEMDETRLKNVIYPLMKRTFNVYVRILKQGNDGLYHIPYTYSDEFGNAEETSLNIALARWGFQTLIESANRLKIAEPLLPKWKALLSKMADYSIDSTGIMIGKDVPLNRPHRHYSHLFGIFPLYNLNIEDNADRIPLMEKSVTHFTAVQGDNCMFKFCGAASLWAALGNGDSSLKWLDRSLNILPRSEPTVTPNTLYSEHQWETFESPIASTRAQLDMLLQSWGGKIRVFPACPKIWKDVQFYHLRAEGGFLVSAVRKYGKTQFISIKSLVGSPCVIKHDFEGEVKCLSGRKVNIKQGKGYIELDIKKGEEVVLYTGKVPDKFEVTPLEEDPKEQNSWGVF